jgi:hypothetical protein
VVDVNVSEKRDVSIFRAEVTKLEAEGLTSTYETIRRQNLRQHQHFLRSFLVLYTYIATYITFQKVSKRRYYNKYCIQLKLNFNVLNLKLYKGTVQQGKVGDYLEFWPLPSPPSME